MIRTLLQRSHPATLSLSLRSFRLINRGSLGVLALSTLTLSTLVLLMSVPVTFAQDDLDLLLSTANQNALSNEDLAKNEARLKRLEEDLLKTLDVKADTGSVEKPAHLSTGSVTITDIKAPTDTLYVEEPARKSATDGVNLPRNNELDPSTTSILKELGQHPALQAKHPKSAKPQRKVTLADLKEDDQLGLQTSTIAEELTAPPAAEKARYQPRVTPQRNAAKLKSSKDENEWTTEAATPLLTPSTTPGLLFQNCVTPSSGRLMASAVASIAVERAALRIGPGQRESALFIMPRYAQVRIEHRAGEWYRVITDTGARGWLSGQALLFDAGVPASSAVRVGSFKNRNEVLLVNSLAQVNEELYR